MSSSNRLTPARRVHPGELLKVALEAQKLRQSDLAERTGLSAKHINQITKETIGISTDVAILLERALDIPADVWNNAEIAYQAYESQRRAERTLEQHQAWADRFHVPTLRRHGIIAAGDTGITKTEKILKLFRVATPAAFEQTWQQPSVSFRRSQAFSIDEPNTALWLRIVERAAQDVPTSEFNPRLVRKAAQQIPAMTTMSVSNGFIAARSALAEAGVALTFTREIPDTRVCAATWWITGDKPAIGITERYRKADIFWFNLLHEVGHIALHPRRTTFLNLDDERRINDPKEHEADSFADEILFPGDTNLEIATARSHRDLIMIAARLRIGLPTVAGRHGKITNNWKFAGRLREKITDDDVVELEAISADPAAH